MGAREKGPATEVGPGRISELPANHRDDPELRADEADFVEHRKQAVK